jgi:hypothetical protein
MPNGARLWWVQHGSPQGVPQETAACTWPCETSRRCSSSGGIIVDSGSTVSESQQEAETVFSQSLCTTASSSSGNFNPGLSSSGSSSGSIGAQSPANGGSSSSSGSGSWSTGSSGAAYPGTGSTGAGATGGAGSNQGGPSRNGKFIKLKSNFFKQNFNFSTCLLIQ